MISNQIDNGWILLSEAVYALIREACDDRQGQDIVDFIKKCHTYSPVYKYSPHRIKRAGIDESFSSFAIEVEKSATETLCARLRSAKIPGNGTTPDGTRRGITAEEWTICHIDIQRNELLAPLNEPYFHPLKSVRIDFVAILKGKGLLRANAAGINVATKWLIGLRRVLNNPAIKKVYKDQAKKQFYLSDRQFEGVWKAASAAVPNDNWGKGGRPRKP